MPSLTRAERETIIGYNDESDLVSIYTPDRTLIRQLEERGFVSKRDNAWEGRVVAKTFDVPKGLLSIRLKSKRTAAQKAAVVANLKKAHARQNAPKALGVSQLIVPKTGTDREQPGKPPADQVAPEKTTTRRAAQ